MLLHCIILSLNVLETYLSVLFSRSIIKFVTWPPYLKQDEPRPSTSQLAVRHLFAETFIGLVH